MKTKNIKINSAYLKLLAVALVCFLAGQVGAADGPYVSEPVTPHIFDGDLRILPRSQAWQVGDSISEVPLLETGPAGPAQDCEDCEKQTAEPVSPEVESLSLMPAPIVEFEGIGINGSLPPDTNGDVGPNHYIQMTNVQFAIWDKTGTQLVAPTNNNALWAGTGTACEFNNDGDPIVLYDPLADRWLMSQFVAFTNQCIAISKTSDPVSGGWWLYDFSTGGVSNDYPKFGVWPDGYYMASQRGYPGGGGDAWAFDRARMLNGLPATLQRFGPELMMMLPSDLDGATPPPAGAPNVFAHFVDGGEWGGTDRIELFEFHVDWVTPTNSTWTALPDLLPTAFDRQMCTYSLFDLCIPQPGTGQRLMTITAWFMWRLQYRNFGTHEALAVNHTVDVGGDHAGIRWYEIRKSGGPWGIHQEGTYAPDDEHRWMGSIAMDRDGNMALGYSVSGSVVPAIRYVGRLASDPLGQMPQGETTLHSDVSFQSHPSGRWGDYSAMTVDPVDDCTFWYTNEYIAADNTWRTYVGAFKFLECDGGPRPPADYCLELDPFCDRLEVSFDTAQNIYGHWDHTCTNDFTNAPVMGSTLGTKPIVGDLTPETGRTWEIIFNLGPRLWRMYEYDGVNPPIPRHIDQPFSVSAGNCPTLSEQAAGLPRSTE